MRFLFWVQWYQCQVAKLNQFYVGRTVAYWDEHKQDVGVQELEMRELRRYNVDSMANLWALGILATQ